MPEKEQPKKGLFVPEANLFIEIPPGTDLNQLIQQLGGNLSPQTIELLRNFLQSQQKQQSQQEQQQKPPPS